MLLCLDVSFGKAMEGEHWQARYRAQDAFKGMAKAQADCLGIGRTGAGNEDRQRDINDVNDSYPTAPSVLQQACSPSHFVLKEQRGQASFAEEGGGCIMRSNASSRKISFLPRTDRHF